MCDRFGLLFKSSDNIMEMISAEIYVLRIAGKDFVHTTDSLSDCMLLGTDDRHNKISL